MPDFPENTAIPKSSTACVHDIQVTRDVMVEMRDGIRLATDIYRPVCNCFDAGPLPVLLERTPYDKSGTNHRDYSLANPVPMTRAEVAVDFARSGYVVVLQDCRGRYNSEGVFTKYLSEANDGFDTLLWMVRQPWCNGKIGTFGLSYGAHTQLALACLSPPGLAAMFLESGGFSSAFHSGIRQGGAFELKQATWAYNQALEQARKDNDKPRERALLSEDIADWFQRMPWTRGNSPLRAAPEYEDYLFEQWETGDFGEYWQSIGIYARGYYAAIADVPMVHMTGWYDPYARTIAENFIGLSRQKHGPVKMIMGPWTHGRRSDSYAGDVDFGAAAPLDGNIAPDFNSLRKAWFGQHLKGDVSPPYLPKPVKIFVMGGGSGRRNAQGRLEHGGRWRDEGSWPPARAQDASFYLQTDGALATAPAGGDGYREFTFDPRNPVPTVGGAVTSGEPLMAAGAFDQRVPPGPDIAQPQAALADRPDVVVFQTLPLERGLEVVGPVTAELFVSSSALDTDITVKLIDVYPPSDDWPDGFAMNLSHGILRLRYRQDETAPSLLEPGKVYQVRIEAFPTANLFAKGHRIRLDVSSSNFPHFDVNPNSGETEGRGRHKVVAQNRIHMGAGHLSRLILPVVAD
jgi:putative CocE/NonD family hydrolase